MDKIKIMVTRTKYGGWKAFFSDSPNVTGVDKRKEGAISALLQDNLGKVVIALSGHFEIIETKEGPAE